MHATGDSPLNALRMRRHVVEGVPRLTAPPLIAASFGGSQRGVRSGATAYDIAFLQGKSFTLALFHSQKWSR